MKKTLTERIEVRLDKEHLKMIKDISKHLKDKTTSKSKVIRVCVFDYWRRI